MLLVVVLVLLLVVVVPLVPLSLLSSSRRYLHLPKLFLDDLAEITAAFEEVWTRRGDTVQALMHGNPRRPHTGATRSFLV